MAGYVKSSSRGSRDANSKSQRGSEESPFIKWLLVAIAMTFTVVFLLLPLVNVFAQAFSKGFEGYFKALSDPDTMSAIL